VREKRLEFAERGWDSIPEEEKAEWFTRFKFWGVFHQREGQESYFMLRLTNCGGILEPGQFRAIGEAAREYATGPVENPEFGNAFVDFTTRQSIQLHWLKLEDIPAVWEKLESVGVTSRSAGGDTMRNISGCPVAGKDAKEYVESRELLDRLQADLRGDDALANMPRKFNISVTGCREGCAQDSINDIGLEPAHKLDAETGEEIEGFNVRVGGGLGGGIGEEPSFVDWVRQRVPADEVPGAIRNLMHAFAVLREEGQSFREWVDATGTETLMTLAEPEETDYEDPCLTDAKQSWYPFDDGESPAPTTPDGTPLSADD
jgi:ferredoxin-nitrite reductase